MRKHRRSLASLSAAVTAALAVGLVGGSPAHANDVDHDSLVERVDRALAEVPAEDFNRTVVAAEASVSIDAALPSAAISAGTGSVGLTLTGSTPASSALTGAARFYGDIGQDTDAVVRQVPAGVQILSVMQTPSAPSSQRYQIDLPSGVDLVQNGDGFALLDAAGEVVGGIGSPWAVDATGRQLPTSYALTGTTLVQSTDTSDAVYPVVADPKLTYGVGVYLNLWGTEVKQIATATAAVIGAGLAIACTQLSKLPHAILKAVGALACGAGVFNLKDLFKKISDYNKNTPVVGNQCYQKKIVPSTGGFKKVAAKNCS